MKKQERQRLGNYWLGERLGWGGFAEVYLGEHISTGKLAAIKVLRDPLTKDKLQRFRTEARITAHLDHPNVVRFLDFVDDGFRSFLILDYVPHGSLHSRHRGEKLALPTILSYVKEASSALDYIHEKGIIHCDVKPKNMLLSLDDRMILNDFGIAALVSGKPARQDLIILGTSTYMSPEQYQGRPCPASDIYSLGIVVFEWLSGYPPFSGSVSEIARQHRYTPPDSLRTMLTGTPPTVREVVLKAVNKHPEERFSSAGAFARALERASQRDVWELPSTHPSFRYRSVNPPSHVAVRRRQALNARQHPIIHRR